MKLLFDANLSPRLVAQLSAVYPGSLYVFDYGKLSSDDRQIWDFAAARDLVVVTKDNDFQAMSLVRGQPPKVIQLRVGNCSTSDIETVLIRWRDVIAQFGVDDDAALLVIDALNGA